VLSQICRHTAAAAAAAAAGYPATATIDATYYDSFQIPTCESQLVSSQRTSNAVTTVNYER
ncbi:MAG: hypothetical protein ACPH9N_09270, partial [Alteromonas sp.]